MPSLTVAEALKALPNDPGVYQYRDLVGDLLYVGKAKNLKNRVSSYFHKRAQHSPRIEAMVAQVHSISIIVTRSDLEALVLEANLIKTHRPKYNVALRDDKKYPWLVLTDEIFPRLEITREPRGKGKSFGPYASPGALYQTLQLVKTIFPLRKRRTPLFKDRPCMNYHIGACLAPCQGFVTPEDYQKIVSQMVMFLRGHADDLLKMVSRDMAAASEAMDFEGAALLRDRYKAIQRVLERQRVMYDDPTVYQDVIGVSLDEGTAYFAVLKVRRGKLIQTLFFDMTLGEGLTVEEVYQAFLFQYYEDDADVEDLPTEVVLQYAIEDEDFLAEWLRHQRGKKVAITMPQRSGPRKDILDMALRNAQESRERARIAGEQRLKSDPAQALLILQERLGLPEIPRRIECYDISHLGGTDTVASMVVFTDGIPDKAEYRRFKIRTTEHGTPDDFQSMKEVITRRFTKREEKGWADPDLVIVDGGKGQLSHAMEALQELGITDQPIVSLAKKFEEIFLPWEPRPVILERDSMALFLIQRIRDEAHRFAITFQRNLRAKRQIKSFLDDVPGIGEKRKQKLLEAFPSMEATRAASLEDIARVTGTSGKTANSIYSVLQSSAKTK